MGYVLDCLRTFIGWARSDSSYNPDRVMQGHNPTINVDRIKNPHVIPKPNISESVFGMSSKEGLANVRSGIDGLLNTRYVNNLEDLNSIRAEVMTYGTDKQKAMFEAMEKGFQNKANVAAQLSAPVKISAETVDASLGIGGKFKSAEASAAVFALNGPTKFEKGIANIQSGIDGLLNPKYVKNLGDLNSIRTEVMTYGTAQQQALFETMEQNFVSGQKWKVAAEGLSQKTKNISVNTIDAIHGIGKENKGLTELNKYFAELEAKPVLNAEGNAIKDTVEQISQKTKNISVNTIDAIHGIGKENKGLTELNKYLAEMEAKPVSKIAKGWSKLPSGGKIAIVLGAVAVVGGVIAGLCYLSNKNKVAERMNRTSSDESTES